MWWGKSSDDANAQAKAASTTETLKQTSAAGAATDAQRYGSSTPNKSTNASTPPNPDKLPDREKLPSALQRIVDKQDKEDSYLDFSELVDG